MVIIFTKRTQRNMVGGRKGGSNFDKWSQNKHFQSTLGREGSHIRVVHTLDREGVGRG